MLSKEIQKNPKKFASMRKSPDPSLARSLGHMILNIFQCSHKLMFIHICKNVF